MYPVRPALLPAISGALRLGPNVTASLAGFKEVSLLTIAWRPAGLVTVHEGTPFVAGVASATVANVGGRAFRRRGPLVSGERPVLTKVAVHGACGSVLPRVAPGVSMGG